MTLRSARRARRGWLSTAFVRWCRFCRTDRVQCPCRVNLPGRWLRGRPVRRQDPAMTEPEALTLKPGDRVCTWVGGKPIIALIGEILPPLRPGQVVAVSLRRPSMNARGRPYPFFKRLAHEIEIEPRPDDGTANVYADWLEEHGEARAAALLREVFPWPERATS